MSGRTLLQFFHWYTPGGGRLWAELAERAPDLARMGITDVWLPPVCKGASGGQSVGYDIYDLYDLGEFDQKGGVPTKYGDRAALERAAGALAESGVGVILDVVFNHKMGADACEAVQVHRVDPEDRTRIEEAAFDAQAYTRFTFPGRAGAYSEFIWDRTCFGGVDRIEDPQEEGVFKLVNDVAGEGWNVEVDDEKGNFDYLMGADVEFRNPAVRAELTRWGEWIAAQIPCAGFRLDAAKHIPAWFFRDWVGAMRTRVNPELFVVAEYWHPEMAALEAYLELVDQQLMLFDVGLVHSFHAAGLAGAEYDLRGLYDGALAAAVPDHAVTFVGNHDTQPLQALEAPVEPWFKPLAYALILLREEGVPCVFYPDLFGADYRDTGGDGAEHDVQIAPVAELPQLIAARARFANGAQTVLAEDPHRLCVIRHGTAEAPGCVVVLSNGEAAAQAVELGPEQGEAAFRDFLGHREECITTDAGGRAEFPVNGGSVSVWVRAEAL